MLRKFGKFKESLVKVYMKEILEGLIYLHDNGVVHRDIKSANILVDSSGVCKLAGKNLTLSFFRLWKQ
jgi:serine/threonine protein kinase